MNLVFPLVDVGGINVELVGNSHYSGLKPPILTIKSWSTGASELKGSENGNHSRRMIHVDGS